MVNDEARQRLPHDLFVTALEGGIGYWSECSEYRWSLDDGKEDLSGFRAVIENMVEEELPAAVIDRDVMVKGLSLAYKAAERYPGVYALDDVGLAWDTGNATLLGAIDFDADTADAVVQLGLFGEVRYG